MVFFCSACVPSSSDYALPCNIEILKMHLQKQKAYCITLVDNNVYTLTEIFRKAASGRPVIL